MTRNIAHWLAALALGVALSSAAIADPPADKGKGQHPSASQPAGNGQPAQDHGNASNGQGKNKSKAEPDDSYDPYNDKYQGSKADANHGQRVSDCNHRANSKQLKGQERKQYVEWCVDNGERYKYDDKRWTGSRNCYQQADDRRLSGDERRRFVNNCMVSSIFK